MIAQKASARLPCATTAGHPLASAVLPPLPLRRRHTAAPVQPLPASDVPLFRSPRQLTCHAAASGSTRQAQAAARAAEEEEEEEEEATEVEQAQQAAEGEAEQQEGTTAALPAETEAVAVAQQQPEMVTEEEVVEVEQVIEPLTMQNVVSRSQAFVSNTWQGKLLVGSIAALALGTLGVAVYRAWQKSNTARAKRVRQIDRNRDLVDSLNKFLPQQRAALTPGEARRIQRSSGFSAVEVFRKYLWYVLRERKFDQGAVEDLVALKISLGLSDADVGEALRERSTRIYDKYGTLMLNMEGLTLAGAQRKASCTALFRKVLYLAETERLVGAAASEPGGSGHVADIGKIFGATVEDMERLRIRNLYEAELDLEGLVVDSADEEAGQQGQQGQEGGKQGGEGPAKSA